MDCYLCIYNGNKPQCPSKRFARISMYHKPNKKCRREGELPYEIHISYPNESEFIITLLPNSITGIEIDRCHLGECLLFINDYDLRLYITEAHPILLQMMAKNFKALLEFRYSDVDLISPFKFLIDNTLINNNFYEIITNMNYSRYVTQIACKVPSKIEHIMALQKCKYLRHLHLTCPLDMDRSIYCSDGFFEILKSFIYLECFLLIDSFVYQNGMLQKLLNCLPSNIKNITLEKNFGTTLPDCFERFTKLETLILKGNCLYTLPTSLIYCKNLKLLDIRSYSRGLQYLDHEFIGAFPKATINYANMNIPSNRFIYGKYSAAEVQETCECGYYENDLLEEPQSLKSACLKSLDDDEYLTLPYDTNNRMETSFVCYNCKKISFMEGHECYYTKNFIQIIGKRFNIYENKDRLETVYFKYKYCKCCKNKMREKALC
uniref:Leucine rich repeat protein bspa family n=1 Tax=Strongyloides stercoralis TaxID=6248 RepID=A0A0K0E7I4_STRER